MLYRVLTIFEFDEDLPWGLLDRYMPESRHAEAFIDIGDERRGGGGGSISIAEKYTQNDCTL